MDKVTHINVADVEAEHRARHEGYEFLCRSLMEDEDSKMEVAHYEIPPGKAAFPYHYHLRNEESYYILSGEGELRTPEGTRRVKPGDFLHFPASEAGAHKLTNVSEVENLVYLDFDTNCDVEIAFYPDSGKMGVWGRGVNKLYRIGAHVDYYDGES